MAAPARNDWTSDLPAPSRYAAIVEALRARRPFADVLAEKDEAGQEIAVLARNMLRREEELRRLFELIDTVQKGLTPEDVLERIYESFADLIPYERIGCAFLSPDGAMLTAHWARSTLGPVHLGKGFSQPMAGSSLLEILTSGQPRILNDLESYLEAKPSSLSTRAIVEEGGLSSLTCPLSAEGRPIGFLFFTSRFKNAYRDLHTEIFRQIAGQLSLVIERSRAFERVRHAAFHDALTDLPNRVAFFDRLQTELGRNREGRKVAVHFIDLDRFKQVNDTMGHEVGDRLLCRVARRLLRVTENRGTLARLGGDEFALIQPDCAAREEIEALARDMIRVIAHPFRLDSQNVQIGATVGISVAESPTDTAQELLSRADIALYDAKRAGRGDFFFFETPMFERVRRRTGIESELRQALASGAGLELYYQPVVSLQDIRLSACEALLRWRHPQFGWVSPVEFIPVAEECGLIVPLGQWVMNTACREAAGWPDDIGVCVNVSTRQLEQPDFCAMMQEALRASGLRPGRLEIELTESLLLGDSPTIAATIHGLLDFGVGLALDDFGTGFSSISYLRRSAFTRLKIDRSFIEDLSTEPKLLAIVRSVCQVANALGMRVTAEGIETEAQLRLARQMGCTEGQGFLIARPQTASEIRRKLGLPAAGTGADAASRAPYGAAAS